MPRPRALLPVLVATVALLAAGCSASGEGAAPPAPTDSTELGEAPTSPSTTEPTAPTEPATTEDTDAPEVGSCWSSITEAETERVSFAGEEVDCAEPHGSVVVDAFELDADLADALDADILDGDVDDPDVYEPVQTAGNSCIDIWSEVLSATDLSGEAALVDGAARATKLVQTFWLPTGAQWDAGARWIRCDLQATDAEFDVDLEGLESLAGQPVPADLVLCLADTPGPGEEVPCDGKDADWQAIAFFAISADLPESQSAYEDLVANALPLSCAQLTEEAVGDVGERDYRAFAEEDLTLSDGTFTCAAKVNPPLETPLGT